MLLSRRLAGFTAVDVMIVDCSLGDEPADLQRDPVGQ